MNLKTLAILLSCACLYSGNTTKSSQPPQSRNSAVKMVVEDKLNHNRDLILENRLEESKEDQFDRTLTIENHRTKIKIFDKYANGFGNGDYMSFSHHSTNKNESIYGVIRKERLGAYIFEYKVNSGRKSFSETINTGDFNIFKRTLICTKAWPIINYGESVYYELVKSPANITQFPLDDFYKVIDGFEKNIPLLARQDKRAGDEMFKLAKACSDESTKRLDQIKKGSIRKSDLTLK